MPGRELWLDGAGRFGGGKFGGAVIGDSDARGDVMVGIESEKDGIKLESGVRRRGPGSEVLCSIEPSLTWPVLVPLTGSLFADGLGVGSLGVGNSLEESLVRVSTCSVRFFNTGNL